MDPHEVDPVPAITVMTTEGLRWSCRDCNQTAFQRKNGSWAHFDKTLNLEEA